MNESASINRDKKMLSRILLREFSRKIQHLCPDLPLRMQNAEICQIGSQFVQNSLQIAFDRPIYVNQDNWNAISSHDFNNCANSEQFLKMLHRRTYETPTGILIIIQFANFWVAAEGLVIDDCLELRV